MTGGRNDAQRIADILRSVSRLEEVLEGGYREFALSWMIQSAVTRELEVIGEAAGEVSSLTRRRHPEIEWEKMRGFSSFAKHEYWRVDPKRLWAAVEEVPALKKKIGKVIPPPD
jgi:uncharacterized protein with HEPN domain